MELIGWKERELERSCNVGGGICPILRDRRFERGFNGELCCLQWNAVVEADGDGLQYSGQPYEFQGILIDRSTVFLLCNTANIATAGLIGREVFFSAVVVFFLL